MSRRPRFDIIESDAKQPFHVAYVAANGRKRWTTENYVNEASAIAAIEDYCGRKVAETRWGLEVWHPGKSLLLEVRRVNQRTDSGQP